MKPGPLLVGAVAVLAVGVTVSLQRPPPPLSDVTSRPAASTETTAWVRRTLTPVANPDPSQPAQPVRSRPYRVVATADGAKAYVTLAGKEITPGREVVVVDVEREREARRIQVGSYPYGIGLHPSGRWVFVTHRYSNWVSVIDTRSDEVAAEIPVPFYCEDVVFSPGGDRAYLSNFFLGQVVVVDLVEQGDRVSGRIRDLGFDRDVFRGAQIDTPTSEPVVCPVCGWRDRDVVRCPRCGHTSMAPTHEDSARPSKPGVRAILRARCGRAGCHLHRHGGFVAGPDEAQTFESAVAHSFPGDPGASPLLRVATSVAAGGRADALDGSHHAGGVVFTDPEHDPDYQALRDWIAAARGPGPGIPVGDKPRDMVVSPDGSTLYVANTGALDVSVVDLGSLRETGRIFTRSPVNDLAWIDGRLLLTTLGVGSGHPKAHHPGRESTDRAHPDAEFTLFRDLATGKPLPLAQQRPLGPYALVDGTRQEKFRDITNDVVLLDPKARDVASYAATEAFTRYTSDSFEALAGDVKGDVPPELMRVVGAFPEQVARRGDRLYVTMSGTFQVQEWTVDLHAPPASRLRPGRVFETGFKPTGIAVAGEKLVVADQLSESVSFVHLADGRRTALSLSRLGTPFPATDFERGELFVQSSVFSVDQDQSCVHCHYRDASDGKAWSVSQVMGQGRDGSERTGGLREVPDLRGLFHDTPFFLEGTLAMDEPLTMMMEHNPLVDFRGETPAGRFDDVFADKPLESSADRVVVATGKRWQGKGVRLADLVARREAHFARTAERYLGRAHTFRDFQRFIGVYQGGEPRLLASPVSAAEPMVRHGRALFESATVGCSRCHPAPAFTDKVHVHNENRAMPPLVTPAPRDNVHTLVSAHRLDHLDGYVRPWDRGSDGTIDRGRVESREGFYVAPSLRGLFARPPRFLHHGRALSLAETFLPPDHLALGRFASERVGDQRRPGRREVGHNELDGLPDLHGTTSQLSVWDVECLERYLLSVN